jgi:hypothetical protein
MPIYYCNEIELTHKSIMNEISILFQPKYVQK